MTNTTANITTEYHAVIRDTVDNFTISTNVFATLEQAETFARNAGQGEGYTVEVTAREVIEDDWLIWEDIRREAHAS